MLIPRIVRSLPQIVDQQIPETIFLAIFLIVALTCIAIHLMQTFFPGCVGLILPIRISLRYSVIKMKIMSHWHIQWCSY